MSGRNDQKYKKKTEGRLLGLDTKCAAPSSFRSCSLTSPLPHKALFHRSLRLPSPYPIPLKFYPSNEVSYSPEPPKAPHFECCRHREGGEEQRSAKRPTTLASHWQPYTTESRSRHHIPLVTVQGAPQP